MLNAIWNFLISNPADAISLVLSTLALIFSFISWSKTRTATLYSDIDGRYLELLKLAIANPDFVNPLLTEDYKQRFTENELGKYEQYAFAAWNVVETIVDRRNNRDLRTTWDPVIREENRLHRVWLNQEENQHKFKKRFWKFMIGNKAFPCPDCEKLNCGSLCARCRELQVTVNSKNEIPIVRSSRPKVGQGGDAASLRK